MPKLKLLQLNEFLTPEAGAILGLPADQRQVLAGHRGDFPGAIAGGVDDDLGDDRAALGRDRPAAVGTRVDCRDWVEAINLGTAVAGAAREGLGELAGVDVAVI